MTTTAESANKGRIAAIAAVLLFASLAMRQDGIGQGLPHRGEPDTYIVHQADELIRKGLADRHRAGWKYPHLVATVVAAVPYSDVERPEAGASLEEHRSTATALHLRTRIVAAILSALAAPATFLIALRFLPLGWAVMAGLLAASSLLHLCFSVQARPHGPVSAFAALSVLAALRWVERPSFGRAVALGAASACAVGSLHTGFAVLAPAAVALVVAWRRAKGSRGAVVLGALAALILVGASAGWFYVRAEDGYGLDPETTAATMARDGGGTGDAELDERAGVGRSLDEKLEGQRVLRFSGHVVPLHLFDGGGFVVAWRTLVRYDPLILGFALLGIAAMLFAGRAGLRRAETWIVLGFAVPTFLLYGMYARSTDRFLLILVPIVALAAASGMRSVARRVPWAGTALTGAATIAIVFAAGRTAVLRRSPDTALEAAAWIEASIESGETVHLTNVPSVPLFMRADDVVKAFIWSNGPWEAYQWALLHPDSRRVLGEREAPQLPTTDAHERLGRGLVYATTADQYRMVLGENRVEVAREILEAAKTDAALVAVNPRRTKGPAPAEALAAAWRGALARGDEWELVHTIENGLGDEEESLEYRLDFLRVLRIRAFGPKVEVYRRVDG